MSDRGIHPSLHAPLKTYRDRVEACTILACLRIDAMFRPMAGHLSSSTAYTEAQLMEVLQNKTPPERG